MSSEIEMDDLSRTNASRTELEISENYDLGDTVERDYTISTWAWTSSTLCVQVARENIIH